MKAEITEDEFVDLCKHQHSQFEIDVRLAHLFSGYHTIRQLWCTNYKFYPHYKQPIPICPKCDKQWGTIAYYFENCKQMRSYGAFDPPFDLKGKFELTI